MADSYYPKFTKNDNEKCNALAFQIAQLRHFYSLIVNDRLTPEGLKDHTYGLLRRVIEELEGLAQPETF